MESGYVATRPRFTRQRRTFGVTYDFLTPEDLRVLDQFECFTVQGEAGAFYMPNLLSNGSFEVNDADGVLAGWRIYPVLDPSPMLAGFQSAVVQDGLCALSIAAIGSTWSPAVNPTDSASAGISSSKPFPVTAGEVYQFNAEIQAINTNPSNISVGMVVVLNCVYSDGTGSNPQIYAGVGAGWQSYSGTITVPTASSGATAAMATVDICGFLSNSAETSATVAANSAMLYVDSVGLALVTPHQSYGRMPGSSPLGSLVRFTKTPSLKDAGWAGGVKRYNCTFEVTEV
jgi:hypothetical protein